MSNDECYQGSMESKEHQSSSSMPIASTSNGMNSLHAVDDLSIEEHSMQVSQSSPTQEDQVMTESVQSNHSIQRNACLGLDLLQSNTFDVVQEAKRVIQSFLQDHQCYNLIKNSSKVVVFDIKIPINLAFFALVEHDIKSVPIWDAEIGNFVGMFTATDFVNILRHFYSRGSAMTELAEHSIATWRALPRSISNVTYQDQMISITPEDSLYKACKILHEHRLHRLPIVDPVQNSVLSILTHSGVLEYLVSTFREQRRLFDQPIYDLGIGTYGNIVTTSEKMPLIMVLHTLIEHKVSAIPIIDGMGVVVNIYSVSNVTELVKDQSLAQLDMPIGEFVRTQAAEGNGSIEGLHTCYKTDTLHMIFEKFAAVKAHRLVCVDEVSRCVGIVSLSDLFNYFLCK